MNAEFKEEYWENALGVLEREERLERRKKFLPWIFIVAALSTVALVTFFSWFLPSSDAVLAEEQVDVLQQDHRKFIASTPSDSSEEYKLATLNSTAQTQNSIQTASNKNNYQNEMASTSGISDGVKKDTRQAQMSQPSASKTSTAKLADNAQMEVETPIAAVDETSSDISNNEEPARTSKSDEQVIEESILAIPTEKVLVSGEPNSLGKNLNLANLNGNNPRGNMSALNPKSPQLNSGVKAQIKFRGFEYHAPFPFKVNTVYAFVGNSFLTGFGSRKNELAFNPEIGVGYELVLGKRWSANASLSYFQIGGITHAAEFSETELGFGFNRTVTTIETSKLHFAYLPIMGSWDFNKRNALSLGIGVSALINGISEVTVTEINDFSESQISQTTDWGYTQGYRTFNASLLAGYEFRLTSRLTFGVHYQHGLREITKSNVYGGEFQDRNSRLRALIKYNFR